MSDYQDLCEMYGTNAGDPDFMDWFLEHITSEEQQAETVQNGLKAGRIVHMVKLVASYPAKPIGAKFNYPLPKDISFSKANFLHLKELDEPASWFLKNGFTVRSMKENGHWYQLAYKATDNLSKLKNTAVKEYCEFAGLSPEPTDFLENRVH